MGGRCAHLPRAHLKSKRYVATAFAAAHARKATHRIRHACSNLFCRRKGCSRAVDMASWATKDCNSGDNLLRPRWPRQRGAPDFLSPPAPGYLRSLRLLARWSTTPSLSAAPVCGEPSQCKAHTSVVSKANWDPPKMGNPSATTSNLRLSAASGTGKSRSRTRTLVVTREPVLWHTRAVTLSSVKPRRPNAPILVHDARWWPNESIGRPTPAHVPRERQWKAEAEQNGPEVWRNLRHQRGPTQLGRKHICVPPPRQTRASRSLNCRMRSSASQPLSL